LEDTNIATKDWPSRIVRESFTAFGVSTSTSIHHLIQVLDHMSVFASKLNEPHQLVFWSKDNQNRWIPGDVWTVEPKDEIRTLEELGWKGGVENPIRVSLLRRPHWMEFQEDVRTWKAV